MKIDTHPRICNLCGGAVVYTTNDQIYGKLHGSGRSYLCLSCGAYVGTHKPRPYEALGLLADKPMRDLKKRCHALFDQMWQPSQLKRNLMYRWLAKEMGIPLSECHFGYFDKEQLGRAYQILLDASERL